MTAIRDLPLDLTEFEFDVACEFPDCDASADVICKGCSDPRPFSICANHLHSVRRRFYGQDTVVCMTCHRPWIEFECHYDVIPI